MKCHCDWVVAECQLNRKFPYFLQHLCTAGTRLSAIHAVALDHPFLRIHQLFTVVLSHQSITTPLHAWSSKSFIQSVLYRSFHCIAIERIN